MATNLEWIATLRDSVTEPARKMRAAVDSVKSSISKLKNEAASGLTAGASKMAADVTSAANRARRAVESVGSAVSRVGGRSLSRVGGAAGGIVSRIRGVVGGVASRAAAGLGVGGGGGGAVGAVTTGADSANQSIMGLARSVSTLVTMKLAEWAFAAGKALLSFSGSAIDFAIKSASFKKNMLASLELIEGTSEKAQETFGKINAIADVTPFETQKVMDLFKSLRSAGMGQDAAEKMFMALSDIASVQGDAKDEILERLKLAVIKIKGTGKLDMETLLQLSEAGSGAGINVESVLSAYAKTKNITLEAARGLLSKGQIKWEEAFKALQDAAVATVNKGKELGTATKLFGTNSFEGAVSTLKSKLDDIFSDIDISPVIKGIQTIANMLSFTVGKDEIISPLKQAMLDLKGVVERTFGAIFKAFGELTTEDALTAIVIRAIPVIEFFGNAISKIVNAVVVLGGAFAQGFEQAYEFTELTGDVDRFGQGAKDMVPTFVSIGRVIGGVAGFIVSYLSIVSGFWGVIGKALGEAIQWIDKAVSSEEEMNGGFQSLANGVRWLVDALGAALVPVIKVLGYVVAGIIVFFQRMLASFDEMISSMGEWSGLAGEASGATSLWETAISTLTTAAQILAAGLGVLGTVVGVLAGALVWLGTVAALGLMKIAELIWWVGEQIYSFVTAVFPGAVEIGTSIVEGIWEGIKAAWGWLKSSVSDLVGELPGISVFGDKIGMSKTVESSKGLGGMPSKKSFPGLFTAFPEGDAGVKGLMSQPSQGLASSLFGIAPTGATQGLGQRGVEQSNTFTLNMPIVVSASGDPASVASAVQQGATSAAPGVSQAFAALAAQFGAS